MGVVCKRTGLTLRAAEAQETWRIQKSSYGPMNPQLRVLGDDPASWGRYDVGGHRTIYSTAPEEAAYAETLAKFRPKYRRRNDEGGREDPLGRPWLLDTPSAEFFDDAEPDTYLGSDIQDEWSALGHMKCGGIAAAWRRDRVLYPLRLPATGWFIDVETADSLAAIGAGTGADLAELGVGDLTVADLRGPDRRITTLIASWLWAQVLDDGSLPHGIVYGSKHSSEWDCWGIWLRGVDDGKSVAKEPTVAGNGRRIDPPYSNKPLKKICKLFGFWMF